MFPKPTEKLIVDSTNSIFRSHFSRSLYIIEDTVDSRLKSGVTAGHIFFSSKWLLILTNLYTVGIARLEIVFYVIITIFSGHFHSLRVESKLNVKYCVELDYSAK